MTKPDEVEELAKFIEQICTFKTTRNFKQDCANWNDPDLGVMDTENFAKKLIALGYSRHPKLDVKWPELLNESDDESVLDLDKQSDNKFNRGYNKGRNEAIQAYDQVVKEVVR